MYCYKKLYFVYLNIIKSKMVMQDHYAAMTDLQQG